MAFVIQQDLTDTVLWYPEVGFYLNKNLKHMALDLRLGGGLKLEEPSTECKWKHKGLLRE